MINVFVCYSHKDSCWVEDGREGLVPYLERSLSRAGVRFWYDHALKNLPGVEYRDYIEQAIDRADAALLMISQEFLNSDFIREVELPRIANRLHSSELVIIPILTGHAVFEGDPDMRWLTDRQFLPSQLKPLVGYVGDQGQWDKVCADILSAVRQRLTGNPGSEKVDSPGPQPVEQEGPTPEQEVSVEFRSKDTTKDRGVLTGNRVFLRKGPSIAAPWITTLDQGVEVQVLDRLRADEPREHVLKHDVSFVSQSGKEIQLRAGYGIIVSGEREGECIVEIRSGQQYHRGTIQRDALRSLQSAIWLLIKTEDHKGWILSDFVHTW